MNTSIKVVACSRLQLIEQSGLETQHTNIHSPESGVVFITLPKKPKAMICTEFRTISLMSHVTKLLLKIIQQRMANKIDKEVSRLQSGFRPGTGTREGIFNLRTPYVKEELMYKKMCIYALSITQKLLIESSILR